jgi:hypothetical protein
VKDGFNEEIISVHGNENFAAIPYRVISLSVEFPFVGSDAYTLTIG